MHIDTINSWNVQSYSSVVLTNWEKWNIFSTWAMPNSASHHVESHLGPLAFMSHFLWSLSLSLSTFTHTCTLAF